MKAIAVLEATLALLERYAPDDAATQWQLRAARAALRALRELEKHAGVEVYIVPPDDEPPTNS